ncbi:MAG: tetratricopeptide repeat protein [Bryobacterales bacterium]|nr:tetratricopeptide repeat protein [Bryobacterales bacterium]
MMSRKKWAIWAGTVTVMFSSAWLLDRAGVRPRETAPPPAPVSSPGHEMKMLEKELEKKPDHAPILLRLSQLKREAGRLDEAASPLEQLLSREPENRDARLELSRILYERGDAAGAIRENERILAADPKQPDALYNLGAIYANQGAAEKALEHWRRAVEADAGSEGGRKAREGIARLGGR